MKNFFSKIYSTGKLYKSLMLYFLTFTCITAIIVFLITNFFIRNTIIEKHLEPFLDYTRESIEINLKEFVNSINLQSFYLTENKTVYNLLLNKNMAHEEKAAQISEILRLGYSDSDAISYISIVTNDEQSYSFANENAVFKENIDTSFISADTMYGVYIDNSYKVDSNNEKYIVFGKKFKNFYTGYDIGYLLFYIKESRLFSIYESSILDGNTTYITHEGIVISHPDKSLIGAQLYTPPQFVQKGKLSRNYNNQYLMNYSDIKHTPIANLQLHNVISIDSIFKTTNKIRTDIIVISIINIVISIAISLVISHRLGKSMTILQSKMKAFGSNEKFDFTGFKNDEIKSLENSFKTLVTEIDTLILKNNEEKRKQKVAELAALQAQINPHFIYNTLDAISWIAKIKKQPEIEKLVYAFASFFRISLHNGDNVITVAEELEHIKSYVTIEQVKFPDQFDVSYQVDEAILSHKTIKIILQPLIENAIKHAFDTPSKENKILVKGYKSGGDVCFEIIDNGKGMNFNPIEVKKEVDFQGGYGVYNVNERILLEYGKGYGLTYRSKLGEGTTVIVRIG